MFEEVKNDNFGLEWEPTHQMVQLIDPVAELRKWCKKIVHVHGKDATIDWDAVRHGGISGAVPFVWHRMPGFGDTNWRDIISILRSNGYEAVSYTHLAVTVSYRMSVAVSEAGIRKIL